MLLSAEHLSINFGMRQILEHIFRSQPREFRELNEYEAKAILTKLGLTNFEQKLGSLSGGQKKRVALAAALINPADVLILDVNCSTLFRCVYSVLCNRGSVDKNWIHKNKRKCV